MPSAFYQLSEEDALLHNGVDACPPFTAIHFPAEAKTRPVRMSVARVAVAKYHTHYFYHAQVMSSFKHSNCVTMKKEFDTKVPLQTGL